jgi:hypothetical protein
MSFLFSVGADRIGNGTFRQYPVFAPLSFDFLRDFGARFALHLAAFAGRAILGDGGGDGFVYVKQEVFYLSVYSPL